MIWKIFKILLYTVISFFALSILTVVAYKFIPPPASPLMVMRLFEGAFEGRWVGINKEWKSYDEISPFVYKALMAGEDGRFLTHNGVDWKAVERAKKINERSGGRKMFGASTISMQTAKNTFLCLCRNYVRKGLEVYFTYLIENIWGKKRILEVYANIIEWGDGVYGVEAAAQKYFGKSAKNLSSREAAYLAAIVPNPRRWSASEPTSYINKRAGMIQGRMKSMGLPK